ncbi:polyphosphoinositide phosphatase-like isoform X2 [Macrosteles quadrilineatus]|uniref:polyphosphoinositide phosphatase-like isoform X2 n=1 Tax=Macrosteles quadrilineatus TaxID=74068 RepID=UPI0023E344C3|nr:polyphosphoinositide phosphatase-like isoform X2 [Macrosteles quadrilineatus]
MDVVMHPIISSIQKIALYETKSRLFVIASNNSETKFRVLKIDRLEPQELSVIDDKVEYSRDEIRDLINMIDMGNRGRAGGAIRPDVSAFGIVGFVRFMEGYYMVLVTKRRRVAVVGLHTIYKIQDTYMVYIPHESVRVAHPDEARYLKMFQSIDLSSNFYFSYGYDITHTLQVNMAIPKNVSHLQEPCGSHPKTPGPVETAEKEDLFSSSSPGEDENVKRSSREGTTKSTDPKYHPSVHYGVRSEPNRRYVWNSHLLSKVEEELHPDWILYIMHGFISQSCVSVFGRSVYIALIARRSNKYAGTRFLKRGANFEGDVANEVETEQLVEDIGISSTDNPRMSSFVQMRGSIPAHWSQDISKMVPKPAITFDLCDPFAQTAGAHFNKLLQRYGSPIIILNLVKEREKKKHESMLSGEYLSAITYLNQFLPPDLRIQYVHFDMARINKGKGANVMGGLADIARTAVTKTGFYASYRPYPGATVVGRETNEGWAQTGIIRVNCVDCLDRTNTAQFALGKCALGYQLCSMGFLQWPALDFDSDCVRLLEVLYEDHGDTLALQYGGSQLVHRIKTYRKTAPWTSQGNDIMQTLSRYYSNTFSDTEKQHAMNLFLGLFVPDEHNSPIWEQVTDYYLHNSLMISLTQHKMKPLTQWWDEDVMECLPFPEMLCRKTCKAFMQVSPQDIEFVDAYADFHRPHEFSELNETYSNNISHSVRDFMPHCVTDFSPFTVRVRPGRRREETAKGANTGKNPSLTGQSSTSSTASTDSSEESDEEEITTAYSESHHSSPAKEVSGTTGLITFDSLFPSCRQTYGFDLTPPSRQDTLLYKRYVLMHRLANKTVEQLAVNSVMSKLSPPVCPQQLSDDSTFQVTPPQVSEKSLDIYRDYVARSSGEVSVPEDKYTAYVNSQLDLFPVIGWEE